jgi:hypothetical protein
MHRHAPDSPPDYVSAGLSPIHILNISLLSYLYQAVKAFRIFMPATRGSMQENVFLCNFWPDSLVTMVWRRRFLSESSGPTSALFARHFDFGHDTFVKSGPLGLPAFAFF